MNMTTQEPSAKNPLRLGIPAAAIGILLALAALPVPAAADPPASRFAMGAPYAGQWTEGAGRADKESGRLVAAAASATGLEERSLAGVSTTHPVPADALRITYIVQVVVDEARTLAGQSAGSADPSRAATSLFAEATHADCAECRASAIRYVETSSASAESRVTLSFVMENLGGGLIPPGHVVVRVLAQAEAVSALGKTCGSGAACSPTAAQATLHAIVEGISASIAYTRADLPDLVVESITATQTDPSGGEAPQNEYIVSYSARVANKGGSDSPGSWLLFQVRCGDSVCKSQYRSVGAIRAGESATASVATTALVQLRPGAYQIHATADAYAGVLEVDESNNANGVPFVVTAARVADLVVERVGVNPKVTEAGQATSVTAEIRNAGTRAAGPFLVRFVLDGDAANAQSVAVPGLMPGASANASVQWRAAAGSHQVDVEADGTGTVPEANEQNNRNSAAFTVRPANRAPVALPDRFAGAGGQTLRVRFPGVLGNDADPDGDRMLAVLSSNVGSGTLQLNGDGSFTYTPSAGFAGEDSFTYRAWDGRAYSGRATVTIEVG